MVYRVYVEKKPGFALEAEALLKDIRSFLQIESLTELRLLNRYDVEGTQEELFEKSISTIFSEPQMDDATADYPQDGDCVFAVEYLPGQYDQRADSAAQCMQLAYLCDRPTVKTARVYVLYGDLTEEEIAAIKHHVINPVESREATLEKHETLKEPFNAPEDIRVLEGFIGLDETALHALIGEYGLAMDEKDIEFCQEYFRSENRDPSLTEIRMIDTYWSDHCRHTTFLTEIDNVEFDDPEAQVAYERYLELRRAIGRTKPVTLMDLGTIGGKYLKKIGKLTDLDESEEINACTIHMDVNVNGEKQKWLLLFKNETHNHPTEIEPFGGAATCIGGAIRDPLSGRGYVYQAMRVTGAADPLKPVSETMPGKLPQKKLVTTAAAGYSSYGNQIGLATGIVDEIYHDGYAAKRMEIGAVIAAAPEENVRRECPIPSDIIVLLGGRTGRDGCGGATGSSKSHDVSSLTTCGAEVQKGNAPEERKLQRLFRNPEATRLIKRCNDFGAGGVSVAIGELADGLRIDLDKVPKKYDGLDGTELAISESQERMAVVLGKDDVEAFIALAESENLEATPVACVTEEARLVMHWRGKEIVNISREFLNSNGAPKHADARVCAPKACEPRKADMRALVTDLNVCSKRGLAERFDSTIGAATVLMPFGGARQKTPAQAMAARIPVLHGTTDTCSVMAYGFNPFISEASPYRGAYAAVVESVARLVAAGAGWTNSHLTFQEYFPRTKGVAERWGLPMGALLGALDAQVELGIAAIGGKDSMSGTFESLDVPPTLVSFAVGVCNEKDIISPEFKRAGADVAVIRGGSNTERFNNVTEWIREGKIVSAYAVGIGGVAEAVFKMGLGNRIGFNFAEVKDEWFQAMPGAFVVELAEGASVGEIIGQTSEKYAINEWDMDELEALYEGKLEPVYACNIPSEDVAPEKVSYCATVRKAPAVKVAQPRVLIPAFPGTNCEYDTARVFERAGAKPEILVVRNLSAQAVSESVEQFAKLIRESQILFLPGGFSGGDEPDGSAKFITAFMRSPKAAEGVAELLARDGLIGGVCNGFQALIKLGLVPFGEIRNPAADAPTLTYNVIGRHQSRLVRTRIASNKSPWLAHTNVDDIHITPISHGEGRFIITDELYAQLAANGQIATQYVDDAGNPTMDIAHNPNGSFNAVEGICSPDGRVFGRMAHAERNDAGLYCNVPGNRDSGMFRSAVEYFK
ncbi:MAG: phosphoribosylformylglycinamidine synthase [Clostridiales bacterium]|nr:phosphoribosylformylglycinamidine synthase [Clostridiales bacterium]